MLKGGYSGISSLLLHEKRKKRTKPKDHKTERKLLKHITIIFLINHLSLFTIHYSLFTIHYSLKKKPLKKFFFGTFERLLTIMENISFIYNTLQNEKRVGPFENIFYFFLFFLLIVKTYRTYRQSDVMV